MTEPVPTAQDHPSGTFEDLLADPHEQFDPRAELLASIAEYAAAPPTAASSQPRERPGGEIGEITRLTREVSRLTSALSTAEQERDEAKALAANCACGTSYETYTGPEADCPVHGAVRAFNEAQAEIAYRKAVEVDLRAELERTREVVEAAKAWRKSMQPVVANGQLPGTRPQTRALVAAVDALRTDKEPQP